MTKLTDDQIRARKRTSYKSTALAAANVWASDVADTATRFVTGIIIQNPNNQSSGVTLKIVKEDDTLESFMPTVYVDAYGTLPLGKPEGLRECFIRLNGKRNLEVSRLVALTDVDVTVFYWDDEES